MNNLEQNELGNPNENLPEENPIQSNSRLRDQSGYRVSPFVYEHGFFNGVLDIESNDFHQFIRSSEQKKMAYVRLRFLRKSIDELKFKIAEVISKRETYIQIISSSRHSIPAIELEIEDIKKNQRICEEEENELKEEKGKINPYYNKLIASVFIICAVVFICAETTIIHDIFFNVLRVKSIDAWLVAFAIAMSSFAMKPAIDRIFEEPFLLNKNSRAIKVLLSCFSAILLITLGLLGYFRTDALLLILQQSRFPESVSPEKWLNTMGAPSIRIFFILFSILLAIAGAICFSIGIPVFKLVNKRKKLDEELVSKSKQQQEFGIAIQTKRQTIAKTRTDLEVAELQLSTLEEVNILEKRLYELYKSELEVWEIMFEHQTNAEISWYEEGRQRGNRYTLADELIIGPIDINTTNPRTWSHSDIGPIQGNEKNDKFASLKGNHLHEKIRSLIDYNLNRKPKLNGHHE